MKIDLSRPSLANIIQTAQPQKRPVLLHDHVHFGKIIHGQKYHRRRGQISLSKRCCDENVNYDFLRLEGVALFCSSLNCETA